eukprot:9491047-Pyramimonas_sp.AAC.2
MEGRGAEGGPVPANADDAWRRRSAPWRCRSCSARGSRAGTCRGAPRRTDKGDSGGSNDGRRLTTD